MRGVTPVKKILRSLLFLLLLSGYEVLYVQLDKLFDLILFVGLVDLSLTCCTFLLLTLRHLVLGYRSPLSSLNVHHDKALMVDLLRLEDLS